MKLGKNVKIAVSGLCIAATLAGAALPTFAVSPAGYTSLSQIEEMNDADPAKVQAIKDALANIAITRNEENTAISFSSKYENSEIAKYKNIAMPWVYLTNDYNDLHFAFTIVSQDSEAPYYWTKADILADNIDDPQYTVSYESSNVSRSYTRDKIYLEMLSATGNDEDAEVFRKILSYERAYIRFNGNRVNGRTRSRTVLMTQENRQAIADIINLYDLLNSATPEERSAALNG